MDIEHVLQDLRPVELPEETAANQPVTRYDALARIMKLADRVGKTGFRATQSSQLVGEQVERLTAMMTEQVAAREQDLRKERARIGELEEECKQLVQALTEIADLSASATSAAERELGVESGHHFLKLHQAMLRVLNRAGLEPTAEISQLHDPEFHEVLDTIDSEDFPAGQITEVVRQGFRYRGKAVRIAKVVVAQ